MRQCPSCKHFSKGQSPSLAGPGEPPQCEAFEQIYLEEIPAHTADLLDTWFTALAACLSQLNNCPFYENRHPRLSIVDLKPPAPRPENDQPPIAQTGPKAL
jgi:hypothetical protein